MPDIRKSLGIPEPEPVIPKTKPEHWPSCGDTMWENCPVGPFNELACICQANYNCEEECPEGQIYSLLGMCKCISNEEYREFFP